MSERLQEALVRIYGQQGEPVGAGVLVDMQHTLTCAHVINEACGFPHDNPPSPQGTVTLDFPLLPLSQRQEARVVMWQPVAQDGSGDIAGLEILSTPPPAAQPAHFIDQPELWNVDFRILGFPTGHDTGIFSHGRILGSLANGHVQLEAVGEFRILPGFSDSPVWSEAAKGVVGILVAAETNRQAKAGFMIPSALLRQAWEKISCRDQLPLPKPELLPTVGGAVAPSSPFYIERQADRWVSQLIQQNGVTLAILGPRQIGKSSLLARLITQAKALGTQVAYLNFQSSFDETNFQDSAAFYKLFFGMLSEELGLKDETESPERWNLRRPNNTNGTRYLTHYLLREISQPLMLAFDEVDRLYLAPFCSDFFGMLRGWHNDRQARPELERLDLVLVASTETNAFIKDLNQSPFNVATRLALEDFSHDQIRRLNHLHGNCLNSEALAQLYALVNGHPYLVRQALHCVATGQLQVVQLFANALHTDDAAPFAEHLRHYELILQRHLDWRQGFRQILRQRTRPESEIYYPLRLLGLVRDTGQGAEARNQLYEQFFRQRLDV
jgi:hypothetical protein